MSNEEAFKTRRSHTAAWLLVLLLLLMTLASWWLFIRPHQYARINDLSWQLTQLEGKLTAGNFGTTDHTVLANLKIQVEQLSNEFSAGDNESATQLHELTERINHLNASVAGPQGPAGADGATGPQGSPGAQGPVGPQGPGGVAECPNGNCLSLQSTSPGIQEAGSINISGDGLFGGDIATQALNAAGSVTGASLFQGANQVCDISNNCSYAAASGGAGYIQNGTSIQTANFAVQSANAGSVVAVIQGASGQSASLTEWRNSAGGKLVTVNNTTGGNGRINFHRGADTVEGSIYARGLNTLGVETADLMLTYGALQVVTLRADGRLFSQVSDYRYVPLTLKAASTNNQTANLQEWQSGTGTVLASVGPTGVGSFPNLLQAGSQVCDISNNCNYASASGSGDYIQNGTSAQTANFNISGNGFFGGNVGIGTTTPNARLEVVTSNDRAAIFNSGTITGAGDAVTIQGGLGRTSTASTYGSALSVTTSITPSSGASNLSFIDINGTINQAGATGITRGVYVRPVLTSAVDYRGIDLANNSGFGVYQGGANAINYFNGNVGVGVNNPQAKLNVLGDTQFYALGATAMGGATNWLRSDQGTVTVLVGMNGSTNGLGANVSSGNIRFSGRDVALGDFGYYPKGGGAGNYGTFRFSDSSNAIATTPNAKVGVGQLYSAGSVAIGTTSPSYLLDVQGGAGIVGQFSGRVVGGDAVNTNEFVTLDQLNGIAGSYIQNSTSLQTASFNISGNGYIGGNVGIGITNPSQKLHVGGRIVSGADITPTSATQYGMTVGATDNSILNYYGQSATANTGYGWVYNATPANAYAWLYTYGYNNDIRIDAKNVLLQTNNPTGNVGINTTNPVNKLQIGGVSGHSGYGLAVLNPDSGGYGAVVQTNTTAGAALLLHNTTNGVLLQASNTGQVGIGTGTNLGAKLTVNGTIGTQTEGDVFSQYDGDAGVWYPVIARYWRDHPDYADGTFIFANGPNGYVGIERPGGGSAQMLRVRAVTSLFEGNLTVTGSLTTGNIMVNGHIITGNTSGSTTIAADLPAGSGATATIDGNDTSGTITITTGTGVATGQLATITFANAYGVAPKVVLTPANGNGASIQYFVDSVSTTSYTVTTNNTPADSTTYVYYYHVMQ